MCLTRDSSILRPVGQQRAMLTAQPVAQRCGQQLLWLKEEPENAWRDDSGIQSRPALRSPKATRASAELQAKAGGASLGTQVQLTAVYRTFNSQWPKPERHGDRQHCLNSGSVFTVPLATSAQGYKVAVSAKRILSSDQHPKQRDQEGVQAFSFLCCQEGGTAQASTAHLPLTSRSHSPGSPK
jgi:hypothetical protein